ncbi:MAG: type II toxin-antitoxin system Phd/YefM family antitoxin [Oscillospiraceae bacterium]|nr:type II toxin-antitoxin system Phd/YefM family antitoxin [Oscillospiraceae bacterium]
MYNVQVRPVRDLRNHYTELEAMLDNRNPIIITKNGRGTAVLLNIEDFADYEEFMHVRYIAEKLKEAEIEAASPDAKWSDGKDVLNRLREKYSGL